MDRDTIKLDLHTGWEIYYWKAEVKTHDGLLITATAGSPQRAVRLAYKKIRRCRRHQCKFHCHG